MEDRALQESRLAHVRKQRVALEFAKEKRRGDRLLSELTANELSGIITAAVMKAVAGLWAFGVILFFVFRALVGCSSDPTTQRSEMQSTGGIGGAVGTEATTGGVPGSGGMLSASGGATSSGGMPASGGRIATGGTSSTGGASGGAANTGPGWWCSKVGADCSCIYAASEPFGATSQSCSDTVYPCCIKDSDQQPTGARCGCMTELTSTQCDMQVTAGATIHATRVQTCPPS